jgi:predicted SprT family Zn-dependent metalloprotease
MELDKAFNIACDLMVEHVYNKFDKGLFAWNNCVQSFGKAYYFDDGTPIIELSRKLVELNTEDEVRDTILHEIAHLLTWGDDHGSKWKKMCVKLGCRPEAKYGEDVVSPPHKYELWRGCDPAFTGKKWYRKPRMGTDRFLCTTCDDKCFQIRQVR